MVSGSKDDPNNALKLDLFNQRVKVGDRNCHLVDGWDEAVALANSLAPKGGDLLLVQGAHGYKDATYSCNSGEISADKILGHLESLSQKHKLGVVIHSCFSGEIMRKKLVRDQFNQKGLSNLCLVTSSQFGRVTYSHSEDMATLLRNAKSGTTLEDLFLKTHSGLISSASWTEAGVPMYFTTKDVSTGMNVLQNIDKITRFDGNCDTPAEASAAICASPGVSSEVFDLLSTFKKPLIKDDLRYYTVTNLEQMIIGLEKKKNKGTGDPKELEQGINCYRNILGFYREKFGPYLQDLQKLTELKPAFEEFYQRPEHKVCEEYKTKLDDWRKETIYLQSFHNAVQEYEKAQERLSRIFTTHNFNGNFDFIAFGKAAAGDKRACVPENKMAILQSLLGEAFFMDEYYGPWDPSADDLSAPDENILGREFSTQIALKGFQNSSILKNSPQNEIDKARSQACKDFKI